MSKQSIYLLIVELFTTTTTPDKVNHFILQLAETKRSTKHCTNLMALEFGTTYQQ